MNRDSNSYTIIYASVMVVLVAVALAFTAISLKPRQEENQRIDKMQQILRAINKREDDTKKVKDAYKTYIKKEFVINLDGQVLESKEGEAFNINTVLTFKELAKAKAENDEKALSEMKLPLYLANVDGKDYYVLPMNGAGLWDRIWGYISIDADNHSTVFGVDFGNKGETPGLGANMSTENFANRFKGKNFYIDGKFSSIRVVKKGAKVEDADRVDAISGGTLTSNGIDMMLKNSIEPYTKFLENEKLEK